MSHSEGIEPTFHKELPVLDLAFPHITFIYSATKEKNKGKAIPVTGRGGP
jgi:hypothetical protein